MDWKHRFKPAGILLACYFLAPALVGGFLGRYDAPFGGLAVSDLLWLGLAVALVRALLKQREFLSAELYSWLERKGRPADLTRELSGKIFSSCKLLVPAALLLPPLSALFPSGLLVTLAKLAAVLLAVYSAYSLWKDFDQFLSQPGQDGAPPPPPPPSRRCPSCGQAVAYGLKTCSFCKKPMGGKNG